MGLLDILFPPRPLTRAKPCPCGSGNDEGACGHRNVGGRGRNGATTRNGRRTSGRRTGERGNRKPSTSDRYIRPWGKGI